MAQYRHVPIDDEDELSEVEATGRYRHVAEQDDELSFEDIHGQMSALQAFGIASGRGAMDLVQGAKQNALMIRDMDKAKDYTAGVNKDLARYDPLEQEFPYASFFGRLAGQAAPLAALPPARWWAAAALGGLEGGTMFNENANPWQKAIAAGIGGGAAGTMQGLINSLWRLPAASTPEAGKAIHAAAEEGVKLRPHDVSSNPLVQLSGAVGEAGLLARSAAAPGAREAAERLVSKTSPQVDLLTSAKNAIEATKTKQDELYGSLSKIMGDSKIRIKPDMIRQQADDLIKWQESTGLPNEKIVKQLKKIRDATPEGNTFESWKRFRTQLGNQMVEWDADGIDAAPLKAMYAQVSEHLEAAANLAGREAKDVFTEANTLTSQMYDLKMTPAGRLVQKEAGSKLVNMLRGGTDLSKDTLEAAKNLFQILDEPGRETGRYILLKNSFDVALDKKGVFVPSKFAGELRKIRNRSEVFFEGQTEMVDQIRKIENLMAHAKDPSKAGVLAKFFVPGSISAIGASIGGALGGAEAAATGAATGYLAAQTLLPYMTRSRGVNALLDALEKTDPGSRESREIVGQLYKIIQSIPAYSAAAIATQPDAPVEPNPFPAYEFLPPRP